MIDMEREEALNAARGEYLEAYENMMAYQYEHDINRRTLAETEELCRLTSICMGAKYRYDNAKADRYRIVI